MRASLSLILLLLSFLCLADGLNEKPQIAIIIDDLGDRLHDGRQVISLSGNLTVGIIPYTPYARKLAQFATEHRKEIILHLPMESIDHRYLGKAGLRTDMTEVELNASLSASLRAFENIRGVSNHMGSRLTQNARIMQWLMHGIRAYGNLYFVDSRTIDSSKALLLAKQVGLDRATRDVFLDNDKSNAAMGKQWQYFLSHANKKGSAIMIAHPYPQTIAFLRQRLAEVELKAYNLSSVSELIRWRNNGSKLAWRHHESSSH